MKFEKWMNALDKALLARFEVGVDDLAMCEQDFKILFLHGYSFTQAADQIASDQGLRQDEFEVNNGDYRHAEDLARNEDFSGFTV